jgi:hypothetical protein
MMIEWSLDTIKDHMKTLCWSKAIGGGGSSPNPCRETKNISQGGEGALPKVLKAYMGEEPQRLKEKCLLGPNPCRETKRSLKAEKGPCPKS